MPVKNGSRVKVEYTGTLEDGTVFDCSDNHGGPLEFYAGRGQVVKGFDDAVMGMEVGQEKEFKLPPSQAYGETDPGLVKKVPRSQLPHDKEIQPGMTIGLLDSQLGHVAARVVEVTDKDVTIDLNHPMAGKTLKFKIKVVGIS